MTDDTRTVKGSDNTRGDVSDRICVAEGCTGRHLARGWCASHYHRWRRYGDPFGTPSPRQPTPPVPCAVTGCDRSARVRGWCARHYHRYRKDGTPGSPTFRSKRGKGSVAADAAATRAQRRCLKCKACGDSFSALNDTGRLPFYCGPCEERVFSENRKAAVLKYKYGISTEEYDALLAVRAGACAICKVSLVGIKSCVDHSHSNQTIRGILCATCNLGIGLFRDDPVVLMAAAAYVSKDAEVATLQPLKED